MKKYFLFFVLLITLCLTFFSLDFGKSYDYFLEYVEEYKSGDLYIEKDLELLSEYREYYINLISSIKSDVQGNETDRLLEKIFNNNKSGEFEKDLALAVLTSYISSDLHNTVFTEEYLNKSAPFYKTFNEYVEGVKEEGISYVSQWIGYSLGIIRNKPDDNFQIEVSSRTVKSRMRIPYTKNDYYFDIFMSNLDEEFSSRIEDSTGRALRDIGSSTDDKTISRAIRKAAIYVVSPVVNNISNQQSEIATEFVEIVPHSSNFNFLRFIVYILLVILSFTIFKGKKIGHFIIYGIVIFEIIFLSFSSELFKSDIEALFYGLFAVSIFAFAFIINISRSIDAKIRGKREISVFLLMIPLIIIMILPVFQNPISMRMDNIEGFYDSFFAEDLKEELLGYDGVIKSSINSNLEDAEKIKLGLNKPLLYSGSILRDQIGEFLKNDSTWRNKPELKGEIVSYYEEFIRNNPSQAPSVSIFQTQFGSLFLIIFMIVLAIVTLFKMKRIELTVVYSSLIVFFTVFLFKGTHILYIEKGSPFIKITSAYPDIFIILTFFVFVFLSFYIRFKNISKEV